MLRFTCFYLGQISIFWKLCWCKTFDKYHVCFTHKWDNVDPIAVLQNALCTADITLKLISALQFVMNLFVKTCVIVLGTYNSSIYNYYQRYGEQQYCEPSAWLKLADLISDDVLMLLLRREHKMRLCVKWLPMPSTVFCCLQLCVGFYYLLLTAI